MSYLTGKIQGYIGNLHNLNLTNKMLKIMNEYSAFHAQRLSKRFYKYITRITIQIEKRLQRKSSEKNN